MLRFVKAEYYRDIESATEGLQMASIAIVVMSYMIDILYYTAIYDRWGIGSLNYKYYDKQIAPIVAQIL